MSRDHLLALAKRFAKAANRYRNGQFLWMQKQNYLHFEPCPIRPDVKSKKHFDEHGTLCDSVAIRWRVVVWGSDKAVTLWQSLAEEAAVAEGTRLVDVVHPDSTSSEYPSQWAATVANTIHKHPEKFLGPWGPMAWTSKKLVRLRKAKDLLQHYKDNPQERPPEDFPDPGRWLIQAPAFAVSAEVAGWLASKMSPQKRPRGRPPKSRESNDEQQDWADLWEMESNASKSRLTFKKFIERHPQIPGNDSDEQGRYLETALSKSRSKKRSRPQSAKRFRRK